MSLWQYLSDPRANDNKRVPWGLHQSSRMGRPQRLQLSQVGFRCLQYFRGKITASGVAGIGKMVEHTWVLQ